MANTIGLQLKVDTKEVKNADGVIDDFTESVVGADNAVDDLNDELGNTNKVLPTVGNNFKKTNASSNKLANSFKIQKGASQQLGYQLQDVAVQAQMGTSWFTIFGQQGSQLAAVLGPAGALFGAAIAIGSAIGGVVYKAFTNVSASSEELKARIDAVTESFYDLDEAQKTFLSEQEEKAIREKTERIKELEDSLGDLREEEAKASFGFDERFSFSDSTAKKLEKIYFEAKEAVTSTEAEISTLNDEINKSSKEIEKLASNVQLLGNSEDVNLSVAFMDADLSSFEADRDRLKKIYEEETKAKIKEEEKRAALSIAIAEQEIKEKERLQARANASFEKEVESARQSLLTQEQLQIEYYEGSLERFEAYANDKNLGIQERQAIEEQLTEAHLNKLEQLEDKSNQKRATSFVDSFSNIETAFGVLDDLTQASTIARQNSLNNDLRNSENFTAEQIANKEKEAKRLFDINKNASLASIIASTATGVMTQLATGNWAGAAAVGSAGALNYAKVASSSYSSPAGSPSSTGTAPASQNTTNNNSGGNIVNLNISNTGGGAIDVEAIQQYLKDGGVLFDADTEQAGALR